MVGKKMENMLTASYCQNTSTSGNSGTLTFVPPYPWDECDCDERCPKCGKKKKKIGWTVT